MRWRHCLVDQTCQLFKWLCNYIKLYNTTIREQLVWTQSSQPISRPVQNIQKLNIISIKNKHKNLNNHAKKSLTYVQTKPDETKAWFSGVLYAIRPWTWLDQFSRNTHGASNKHFRSLIPQLAIHLSQQNTLTFLWNIYHQWLGIVDNSSSNIPMIISCHQSIHLINPVQPLPTDDGILL